MFLYDTDKDDSLQGMFDNLLSVYTPQEDLPDTYPSAETALLGDALKNDWDIFSKISKNSIINIVKALSPTMVEDVPNLFSGPVGIPEKYDLDYLQKHSIVKTQEWLDFVDTIKHKNRFHTNKINTDLLRDYCCQIEKVLPAGGKRYYRGRIAHNAEGFKVHEMGGLLQKIRQQMGEQTQQV